MASGGRVKRAFGLRQENLAVWGASVGHGFTHWYPSTFYMLLPLIKDEMGLSYTQMGFLITVRYLVSAVANLPAGMLTDLAGKHRLLMAVALCLVGIPYLFVGLSSSYHLLLVYMAFIGFGSNLWHPAAMAGLSETYPSKRGWAMGWHASAANIGDALGPFLSGVLLTWITWRHILMGSSMGGLLMGLFIWRLLGTAGGKDERGPEAAPMPSPVERERQAVGQYLRGLARLVLNPDIFLLSLVNGVRSLIQNGLSTFLPSYFMNLLNLSPWLSGVYMTVLQIAGIVAAPVSGHLSDQFGRRKVVTAALFSTSLAVFLLAFLSIPWLFVVFLGVLGFFLYSLRPVLMAWTMETAPKKLGGSAVGVQFSFQSGLSALSPVLGGWIADNWGLVSTFYFLAATLLLSNLLVYFIKEPERLQGEVQPGAA